MKNIEKWLKNNKITFRRHDYGTDDPRDGFCVSGLFVSINGYLEPDFIQKLQKFEAYMARRSGFTATPIRQYIMYSFRVLSVEDERKYQEHEWPV